MDRKRRTEGYILALSVIMALWACSKDPDQKLPADCERCTTSIILKCPGYGTKAALPDEDKVNNLNIIIFQNGEAEETIWQESIKESDRLEFKISFVKGRRYTICAIANLGRRLDIKDYEEWEDMRVEIQESDGYRQGIPMSACIEDIVPENGMPISMELIRMAAKISLRIDRSRLSDDVRITVKRASIGNCPRHVSVTGPSKILSPSDVFKIGFDMTRDQCSPLNNTDRGLSGAISLYMLENMQGAFPHKIGKDEDKVLAKDDPLAETASFIELEMEYNSSELISYDSPLIYRFYLGESLENLDIERNCHYHIIVTPEDDGLSGTGWRVDKSGIGPSVPFFRMQPGEYVEGHVGDTLRVWCECYPRTSPFDPGLEELEYDKARGIYDYKVDDDRHGVTLYLKKSGTGIIYMTAGEPVDASGMVLVCVLP